MNKPKFDPNKPFTTEMQGQKPKFNPNLPFSDKPQEKERTIGQTIEDLVQVNVEALPMYGAAAGGVLSGGNPVGAGIGQAAGESVKSALQGVGQAFKNPQQFISDLARLPSKEQVIDEVNKYLQAFNIGATSEMGGQIIGKGIQAAAGTAQKAGQSLSGQAENLAETATGATGLQASKFKPQAGRELLERKIVQAGDTPAKVAEKSKAAIEAANKDIDTVLKSLDDQGVKVQINDVKLKIEEKIKELAKDPAQSSIVKKLNSILEDIAASGETSVNVSAAEKTKRGFNKIAGNWLDPEKGEAGKIAYRAYRDAVEQTATKANPELAKVFKEAKQTYGLMSPIEEAASRRAETLKQSPIGGLLDVAAAGGAGAAVGGIEGLLTGVGVAAARRVIAPRIPATAAVTADLISKELKKAPQYAKVFSDNPQVFNSLVNSLVSSYSKSAQKGIESIKNAGFDQTTIDQLQSRPEGRKILEDAAGVSPNSKAMDAIKSKIDSLNLPKAKQSYPMILRKGNQQATIYTPQDYIEAKKEGWK